jgi:hypothetical protein
VHATILQKEKEIMSINYTVTISINYTTPEHLRSPLTDVTVVIEGAYKGQVMEIAFSFLFYRIY